MLFDAANCTLHAGLHGMIVCYHQLEQYIVVSTVFFDFVRLKYFCIVYSQIANLSANEGDEASSLLSDSDGHRLAQFVHKSR